MVYRDDRVAAFMDIQPVNSGHVLVIPVEHVPDLGKLDPGDGGRIFAVGQQVAGAIYRSDIRAEAVNFFLADGEAAGQDVFHVHLHVIPRYEGDGFGLTFAPEYFSLPPRRDLDLAADTIRTNL